MLGEASGVVVGGVVVSRVTPRRELRVKFEVLFGALSIRGSGRRDCRITRDAEASGERDVDVFMRV